MIGHSHTTSVAHPDNVTASVRIRGGCDEPSTITDLGQGLRDVGKAVGTHCTSPSNIVADQWVGGWVGRTLPLPNPTQGDGEMRASASACGRKVNDINDLGGYGQDIIPAATPTPTRSASGGESGGFQNTCPTKIPEVPMEWADKLTTYATQVEQAMYNEMIDRFDLQMGPLVWHPAEPSDPPRIYPATPNPKSIFSAPQKSGEVE